MGNLLEVLLIRHPQTVANAEARHVARGDSPYSERGSDQVAEIERSLAHWSPDIVFASPQRRALVPARRGTAVLPGVMLRVDADLREYDVGLAEGLTHEEGVARGLISEGDWTDPQATPYVGGERVGDFIQRCRAAWARVAAEQGRVAVVSHRGVIALMLVDALDLAHEALWEHRLEPARGALVRVRGDVATLESWDVLPGTGDDGTMHTDP